MIVSPLDHEPYSFFARRTADQRGPPSGDMERWLAAAMESLLATLFESQVGRHGQEIKLILAPDGYFCMSFELLHAIPERAQWFMSCKRIRSDAERAAGSWG